MTEVFDRGSISNVGTLVPGDANVKWTNPDTGVVYNIPDGLFRAGGGGGGETNDNVKFQPHPNGTVYMYTVNNGITASVNNPNTTFNETTAHPAIITYALNSDGNGNITMNIVQVQDKMIAKDPVTGAVREFVMQPGNGASPYLEKTETSEGTFLVVKNYPTNTNLDIDKDGDVEVLNSIAIYKINDSTGRAAPVDAKIWDTFGTTPDTTASDPELVNTDPGSPYIAGVGTNQKNFTILHDANGTPVIMQYGDSTNEGSLISLNNDGTFRAASSVSLNSTNGSNLLFANSRTGGGASVTVGGKTYVYGTNNNAGSTSTDDVGRGELTVDPVTGVPTLSNFTFSSSYTSAAIFAQDGSVDLTSSGGQTMIMNVPDIGDGNKYLLIGNSVNWQFFKVGTNGVLSGASNLGGQGIGGDSLHFPTPTGVTGSGAAAAGPIEGVVRVKNYVVNGQEYDGWMVQSTSAGDSGWYFYNPQTGFRVVVNLQNEDPYEGDHQAFLINGDPVWLSTDNSSKGLAVPNATATTHAFVAKGGDRLLCFTAGTQILTDRGNIAVESLRIGDMVETLDNGLKPIRWIGISKVSAQALEKNPKLRPIHISAGALGSNIPHRSVEISPQHRVLLRSKLSMRMFGKYEILTAAKNLTNCPGVYVAEPGGDVHYYHLMFDGHEILFADGLLAESMLAGNEALKSISSGALEELYTIFPELRQDHTARHPARHIAGGAKVRQYVKRSVQNHHPLSA